MIPQTYIAIDLKSYYASAECAARGLDPLTTNLVVADASRTEKTICLAVSPSLKACGISGRARLFEVIQKVKEINTRRLQTAIRQGKAVMRDGRPAFAGSSVDAEELKRDPSLELDFIIAPPQMDYYMRTSTKIYGIYEEFVAPEDTLVYSIDEVFLDVTPYLPLYGIPAHELALRMIREVLRETRITATAGIGTNMYLAKVAMDVEAKHMPADADGVRIAELTEDTYRTLMWDHRPLTDFWMTGPKTAKALERLGIRTMGELARFSVRNEEVLFRRFGVNAELMIDHAWGVEPCGMREIREYRPQTSSLSEGQVLAAPYPFEKARIIVAEMADSLVWQLTERKVQTDSLTLDIGYDRENVDKGTYTGAIHIDHYGRRLPKPAHGTARLGAATGLASRIVPACEQLFDRIADPDLTVRRITITANRIREDDGVRQLSLFDDIQNSEREQELQRTVLTIKKKYGKNALFKGMNLFEGATMRDRNRQVGGHTARSEAETLTGIELRERQAGGTDGADARPEGEHPNGISPWEQQADGKTISGGRNPVRSDSPEGRSDQLAHPDSCDAASESRESSSTADRIRQLGSEQEAESSRITAEQRTPHIKSDHVAEPSRAQRTPKITADQMVNQRTSRMTTELTAKQRTPRMTSDHVAEQSRVQRTSKMTADQMANQRGSRLTAEQLAEQKKTAAKYADIIRMRRPEPSAAHPRMPIRNRAKQFSPFDPLRGYSEMISEETQRNQEKYRR